MVITGNEELWVRYRRGSLRNGYHFYGWQQARKLPNPNSREVVTINIKQSPEWDFELK